MKTATSTRRAWSAWEPRSRWRARWAIVEGVDQLRGAPVMSHDLRGGAALVVAGLALRAAPRWAAWSIFAVVTKTWRAILADLGARIREVEDAP